MFKLQITSSLGGKLIFNILSDYPCFDVIKSLLIAFRLKKQTKKDGDWLSQKEIKWAKH